MKTNMGTIDRWVRIVLAFVFGFLAFKGVGGATGELVFLVLGIVMAATALLRFCPLYTLLGLKTN